MIAEGDDNELDIDLDVHVSVDEDYSRVWKIHAINSIHSCESEYGAHAKKKSSPFDCSMFIQDCLHQVDVQPDISGKALRASRWWM